MVHCTSEITGIVTWIRILVRTFIEFIFPFTAIFFSITPIKIRISINISLVDNNYVKKGQIVDLLPFLWNAFSRSTSTVKETNAFGYMGEIEMCT